MEFFEGTPRDDHICIMSSLRHTSSYLKLFKYTNDDNQKEPFVKAIFSSSASIAKLAKIHKTSTQALSQRALIRFEAHDIFWKKVHLSRQDPERSNIFSVSIGRDPTYSVMNKFDLNLRLIWMCALKSRVYTPSAARQLQLHLQLQLVRWMSHSGPDEIEKVKNWGTVLKESVQ